MPARLRVQTREAPPRPRPEPRAGRILGGAYESLFQLGPHCLGGLELVRRFRKTLLEIAGGRLRRAHLPCRCDLGLEGRGALGDLGQPRFQLCAHRVGRLGRHAKLLGGLQFGSKGLDPLALLLKLALELDPRGLAGACRGAKLLELSLERRSMLCRLVEPLLELGVRVLPGDRALGQLDDLGVARGDGTFERRGALRLGRQALLELGTRLGEPLVRAGEPLRLVGGELELRADRLAVHLGGTRAVRRGAIVRVGIDVFEATARGGLTGGASTLMGGWSPAPKPVAKPYSVLRTPPCWVASAWATDAGVANPSATTIAPSGLPELFCSASAAVSCSAVISSRSTSRVPRGSWGGRRPPLSASADTIPPASALE